MNMTLPLIGRTTPLFTEDVAHYNEQLREKVASASFLVLGGAGSIGQAVVKEIIKRQPRKLHVVDLSENNLAELTRDIRSSIGYIRGNFQTFTLDINSLEFDALMAAEGDYDYILNLSALKHVRSEKDPYTLMRLMQVNIFNTIKTLEYASICNAKNYFSVSTDKATAPINMMGASKRIMELFLSRASNTQKTTTARFANVAFSDGSLLHSFNQRLKKNQPIVAPDDVRRWFITTEESGELCLMACLLGENREIFFPKPGDHLPLTTFSDIAVRFLQMRGYQPTYCASEEEARALASELKDPVAPADGQRWPCFITKSDTTGEKLVEEFFTAEEHVNWHKFNRIGVIQNTQKIDTLALDTFSEQLSNLRQKGHWTRGDIIACINIVLPDFKHKETGKFLDDKM